MNTLTVGKIFNKMTRSEFEALAGERTTKEFQIIASPDVYVFYDLKNEHFYLIEVEEG